MYRESDSDSKQAGPQEKVCIHLGSGVVIRLFDIETPLRELKEQAAREGGVCPLPTLPSAEETGEWRRRQRVSEKESISPFREGQIPLPPFSKGGLDQ